MQVINADPKRMIDLPGVGHCLRPVDIHQEITGFKSLKSLRIYRFQPGVAIDGESEGDEVWIVPLEGQVALTIFGPHPLQATLSANASGALYMTPDHAYRLTPDSAAIVAYARSAAEGHVATHLAGGVEGARSEHLTHALQNLADGETLDTDRTKERLVHVVAGRLKVDGQTVLASQTAAFAAGEAAEMRAAEASLVLVFTA